MQDLIAGLRELRRLGEQQLRVLEKLERAAARMDEGATSASTPSTSKPKTVNDSDYLTPAKIADILKVSKKTVYVWLQEGRLKASELGHRTKRVRTTEFERFLREHEEGS